MRATRTLICLTCCFKKNLSLDIYAWLVHHLTNIEYCRTQKLPSNVFSKNVLSIRSSFSDCLTTLLHQMFKCILLLNLLVKLVLVGFRSLFSSVRSAIFLLERVFFSLRNFPAWYSSITISPKLIFMTSFINSSASSLRYLSSTLL